MSDWIEALPVAWMGVVVFGGTFLVAGAIYLLVIHLASEERARAFKGVSPGLLPPLGIIFGLLVAFVAAQVWGDNDRATAAVNREASALRAVVLLSRAFPGEADTRMRSLITRHIREAADVEWPAMARHDETLAMIPAALGDALALAVALPASGEGQADAQREMIRALEDALDARRQRILISQSAVNWVKWVTLIVQAICMLVAVAMVHSDNPATTRITLGLFSTSVAVCMLLILAHDRPFHGQLAVKPTVLMQVAPDSPVARAAP